MSDAQVRQQLAALLERNEVGAIPRPCQHHLQRRFYL